MLASKFFSLGSIIRIMIIGALVTVIAVIVQSCQSPETDISRFAKGPLKRLHVKQDAPTQPSLVFKGPNNTEMTLADYRGKVILLNVWATWCAPCKIEMPMLNDLQDTRGNDKFQVVTVSIDRIQEEPEDFFKKGGFDSLTPWHDSTFSLPPKVSAPGMPVSIFYNENGREIARVAGEVDWTDPQALKFIDHVTQ